MDKGLYKDRYDLQAVDHEDKEAKEDLKMIGGHYLTCDVITDKILDQYNRLVDQDKKDQLNLNTLLQAVKNIIGVLNIVTEEVLTEYFKLFINEPDFSLLKETENSMEWIKQQVSHMVSSILLLDNVNLIKAT